MHQSNDDNNPSVNQTSVSDAEPSSTPPELETGAVPDVPPNQDLGDQMVIMIATAAADDGQPSARTSTTAQKDISKDERGTCLTDGVASKNNEMIKQRFSPDCTEIGATPVNEPAPQVNRRFYLGLDRPSVMARNARARRERARNRRRQEAIDAGDIIAEEQISQSHSRGRHSTRFVGRISTMFARVTADNPEGLISATLVEEGDEGEVFEAEQVGFFERKSKTFGLVMCFILVLMAVLVAVLVVKMQEARETVPPSLQPSLQPSMLPSSPPSFTPEPTLETVQTRGHLLCGLRSEDVFGIDFCRAIAAVLFGDPTKFKSVMVNPSTRFKQLNDRTVDVLLSMDTHTVEREVRERTTGIGFTFSMPYFYDGLTYYGNETFVRCAEELKRFGECTPLQICVEYSSSHRGVIESSFPPGVMITGSSIHEARSMLLNGTCNVIASYRSMLIQSINERDLGRNFMMGNVTTVKEPLAIVTRKHDREFSDIVNWVLQAIFYGEEQGLGKGSKPCPNSTNLTGRAPDLDFLNAVYCVGSYFELCSEELNHRGMNNINNGTTGMLYAIPFGELDSEGTDDLGDINNMNVTFLNQFGNEKNKLNCGVIVPLNSTGDANEHVGMREKYCRIMAAALFNGDSEAVKFVIFTENDENSFVALDNETIDVLVGAKIEHKYDFESNSLPGFHFSTPFHDGNETASDDISFFSLATREDDALFSSFVNCVVLATLYAEEKGIKEKNSKEMPLSSLFGSDFSWALRDAIHYSGGYDQIYKEQFGDATIEDRGRNVVNERGGPQHHSFPGLKPSD